MVNLRTTKALDKLESVFLAFLIVSLLFPQISSPVLAESGTHAGVVASDYAETLDRGGSGTGVPRTTLEAVETSGLENRLGRVGETDRETYRDPVFASIVSEFADEDSYVAPTFVAGDGTVVGSVVFDDVGPCVLVLVPATKGV